jgi:hypothetical protein
MAEQQPQMWDVIDKMNDELADVQTELAVMKGAFNNTNNENIILKNIVKSLLVKIITLDEGCDLVCGGMKIFTNEKPHGFNFSLSGTEFKYTNNRETPFDDVENTMKKIVKEMNDSDWNDDDGDCKLYYKNKVLECFMDEDMSSEEDSSEEEEEI